MPFQSFENASSDPLVPPSLPVLFGRVSSSSPASGPDDTPPPFASTESDSRHIPPQYPGRYPTPMRLRSPPLDDHLNNARSESPPRLHSKDERPKSPPLLASVRARSSPLPPSLPSLFGWASSSSLSASTADGIQPPLANTEFDSRHIPSQYLGQASSPMRSMSPPLDNHLNNVRGKSPPRLYAYDGRQKSPPLSAPVTARSPLPAQANNLRLRSSSPMPLHNARTRPPAAQDQTPRLFTAAIQQFKQLPDGRGSSFLSEQQRDEQAKERRLRRFNADVDYATKASQTIDVLENHNKAERNLHKRGKGVNKISMEVQSNRDPILDRLMEIEGPDGMAERDWQSVEAILGSCPDMCPESERQERERKGDLDKFERLDGDRNQTSKVLAVKKYTRTAEREAILIRPLSVLLMTMDHLLNLINRGYDDGLLNVHNFLWDRMRAIRMDLRMQHIFNQQAIVMHEQMIRFHILAMHELCEYTKGEGFSEGFDAHLNIEQMNKASVDLFQMYDDLRKQGNPVASEAEFRGYYALLKLDKHPGYVVEPAELSLDLAKMTPEMRNASEVQFARQVARACRSGNYLAFFRLARNATYLQACLMHAHFSKLRSQAMASLYSGLQKNQGIPIAQVEEWLAMEGEDIEALVEYHGFSLKNYEELYMVKEGPFTNENRDFQTRRAKLVEEKQSMKVVDDVLTSGQGKMISSKSTSPMLDRVASLRRQSVTYSAPMSVPEEEMPDYEEEQQFTEETKDVEDLPMHAMHEDEESPYVEEELQVPVTVTVEATDHMPTESLDVQEYTAWQEAEQSQQDEWLWRGKRRKSSFLMEQETSHDIQPDKLGIHFQDKKPRIIDEDMARVEFLAAKRAEEDNMLAEAKWREEENRRALHQVEASFGKIRFLLRRWKLRAASKAEERCWRQKKVEAALSSFHLGLPVQSNKMVSFQAKKDTTVTESLGSVMELDVRRTERERFHKLQKMWASLSVSAVVAPTLKQKNPESKFLCWKLLLCSRVHDTQSMFGGKPGKKTIAGEWLLAKLFDNRPFQIEREGGLLSQSDTVVSQELVCMPDRDYNSKVQFYFIAKDVSFQDSRVDNKEGSQGASGLLFLLLEGSPLSEECARLHALVNTLPAGASLPLLILCTQLSESAKAAVGDLLNLNGQLSESDLLVSSLHLRSLDKSKVACWSVVSITENQQNVHPVDLMGNPHFRDLEHTFGKGGDESRGFYSEDSLKEGLSWLAMKAPVQPDLRCLHVQDLVLEYLEPSVKKLLSMQPSEVIPGRCIQIFNEALQRTAGEVTDTALSCCSHWPPVELRTLLRQSLPGGQSLSVLLPGPGWNEAASLQPVLEALNFAQLPPFPLMGSKLALGNSSLKRQKGVLEQVLYQYVNQVCGIRQGDLLTLQVVNSMIQKGCVFSWTDSGYLLIPNWALIFQHMYHMRLTLLNSEPPPVVWVSLRQSNYPDVEAKNSLISMDSDHAYHSTPSLDEMIEMESQGLAVMKNLSNAIHRDRKGAVSAQRVNRNFMVLQTGGVRSSEANKEGSFEALEFPSIRRGEKDFATSELNIELPTKEEIELENIVNDFCRKVDQQVAETAKLEDGQAFSQLKTKQASHTNAVHAGFSENVCFNPPSKDSSGEEASSHEISSPCWATSDGMEHLNKLLNHCETVQGQIDNKLMEYFRVEEAA